MRLGYGYAAPLMAFLVTGTAGSLAQAADQIVHDAEYYVLEAQSGRSDLKDCASAVLEARQDATLDVRRTRLRQRARKHGFVKRAA